MKTIYLIKSPSQNINFGCNPDMGLHFIESAVDIKFLDNVVIDQRLKLQVYQKKNEKLIGMGEIWFVILSDLPLSNQSLEVELSYVRNIGNQLFKVTKLGQKFSYKNIYSIPNISDDWAIEDIYLNLNQNGSFKEVYFLDKSKPIKSDCEHQHYEVRGKTVKADLALCVGSDSQQTQSQYVHITLPSKNMNIDSSNLRVNGELHTLNPLYGVDEYRTHKGMILEIYNNSITTDSIFSSFLLLFQIIELIIDLADAEKLNNETIKVVMDNLRSNNLLDSEFLKRIQGMLKGLKKETSKNLLKRGVETLIGKDKAGGVDFSNFSDWRVFRGKLTHPQNPQDLTDTLFVKNYMSLRSFIDELVWEIYSSKS